MELYNMSSFIYRVLDPIEVIKVVGVEELPGYFFRLASPPFGGWRVSLVIATGWTLGHK